MSQQTCLAAAMAVAGLTCVPFAVHAAPIVFAVGGSDDPGSIQTTVDGFRSALGDPDNLNAPGQLQGRREINWDGGGSDATAAAGTPFNGFQNIRGGQFTTPGTGFFQAPPAGGPQGGLADAFGNPTYAATFGTFSSPRLFVPQGSNVTDGCASKRSD